MVVHQANKDSKSRVKGKGEGFLLFPFPLIQIALRKAKTLTNQAVCNCLHHFDVVMCEKLLRKIKKALVADGRVIVFEFIPNADRISTASKQ
ncbi:methyltransferase [Nostoc sp. LEGE 12447]|uniref:methyltransferase n=1 Tax=unclassified Nostoc TaxID=2593658 RepID=UPI002AD51E4D|nr:methyltransferase [Nostoc sp. LEGE 12447]